MWEIRLLRSTWRGLETESRSGLHGHERGNPRYRQDHDLRTTAPALDPTRDRGRLVRSPCGDHAALDLVSVLEEAVVLVKHRVDHDIAACLVQGIVDRLFQVRYAEELDVLALDDGSRARSL